MTIIESYQNVYNFHLECEASFTKVKKEIISDTILTHYDPDLTFILQLPFGLGVCITVLTKNSSQQAIRPEDGSL